jgi:hypothetical protein
MSLRTIRKYFFPKKKRKGVPLQYSNGSDCRYVEAELLLIIKGGYARDKQQARKLLESYGLERARDLIPLLPTIKRVTAREKLRRLIMRILGEEEHARVILPRVRSSLPVVVSFRKRQQ